MGDVNTVREVLSKLGFGYALLGEQGMRARAYSNAARVVKKFGPGLPEALRSGELAAVRGIGPGVLDVVRRALEDREVPALVELEERIPAGLFEARKLPGLGPKKLAVLWTELGLTTVGEIEYACNENRLLELKGFGPKTQDKVLEAVAAMRERAGRMRLDEAQGTADRVLHRLAAAGLRASVVGELRRSCEVIEGVGLLVLAGDEAEGRALGALAAAGTAEDAEPEPVQGEGLRWIRGEVEGRSVELALCPEEALYGVLTLLLTGSPAHVEAVVARAEARGGLLDAEGLFLGGRRVPCPDEADVYAALDLLPTATERREAGLPLTQVGQARPRLLRREDLRGALHNHTTASDGIHGLEDMAAAAAALGLEYLGISDHSRSAAYAGGLDIERLEAQAAEIERLNATGLGCVLLTGVESDILADGALDYPEPVLAGLDVVVASVHSRHGQDRDAMTARMVAAASSPLTTVVGHPTGRLILGRPPSEYDVSAMLAACARSGAAVELNANPQRLDLNEHHLAEAKERGVLVSVAADAHSAGALAHLDWGVRIARRAGLTAEDVLNARALRELREWLTAR